MFSLRKRDANERPIIDALRAIGCVVTQLNDFGCPDLLVGYRSRTILLEVKDPDANQKSARSQKTKRAKGTDGPPENAKGQLTKAQVKWWGEWIGGEAYVVETPEDAVRLVRGVELPYGVGVLNPEHKAGGSIGVALGIMQSPTGPQAYLSMTPDQAVTLSAAIYEQSQVARSWERERSLENESSDDDDW